MELIADLHIHSKYSRAGSHKMVIPEIARWARRKGIDLVGAPDWTHPLWLRELKNDLVEVGEGVYAHKEDVEGTKFFLVTEISSIYSQDGRGRRIHTLFFAPNFSVVELINEKLRSLGVKLLSDGRPVTGLSVKELTEIVLSVSKDCLIVPSHLWTPWFGTYGDRGGFNSLKEAYGNLVDNIYAVETGHSSDPAMNWRIGELDSRTILSFSDAHSPPKMSRESTVFDLDIVDFTSLKEAITNSSTLKSKAPRVVYTIEFYPQEGKYHFTGHRKCEVRNSPGETKRLGKICPVCGKELTVGVMHRVEKLATRSVKEVDTEEIKIARGVKGIRWQKRPPYVMLVPLVEILSETLGAGVSSQMVETEYNRLIERFGSEFNVLLKTDLLEIAKTAGEKVSQGIKKVKEGEIVIEPGFDGVFGTVKIWGEKEKEEKKQMSLF
jgi:uncharacterized protein (TIGR00375 family)